MGNLNFKQDYLIILSNSIFVVTFILFYNDISIIRWLTIVLFFMNISLIAKLINLRED